MKSAWVAVLILVAVVSTAGVTYLAVVGGTTNLATRSTFSSSQTPTTVVATSSQSSRAPYTAVSQLAQESGTISTVDSGGGEFTVQNVGYDFNGLETTSDVSGSGLMVVNLNANQPSGFQFGQDVEVRLSYVPLQRIMFDTVGKVVVVSTGSASIALTNSSVPSSVPTSWNPQVGGEVTMTIIKETEVPLVAITGLQYNAEVCNEVLLGTPNRCINGTATTQFAAFVDSPACLRQSFLQGNSVCVMKAAGQNLSISFEFSNFPFSPGEELLVSSSTQGFSVLQVQSTVLSSATIILRIPSTDYAGTAELTFTYLPT